MSETGQPAGLPTVPEEVPATPIEPVIPDEVIDGLTLDAGGLDDLTRTVKTLEHYGAKFPPWFCDQPLADVRAGLKEAARSERVREAFRREREFEESRQPEIPTTGATIHEMSEEALAVVNKWNNPPELFARSACLVRAALDERGGLYIQELDENGLTGILDRLIAWTRLLKGGEERPVHPPREVVRDILSLPAATWRVPHLAGVTGTPIFHQNGIIHATPGYDADSCLYYYPTPGFTMPPVPEVPTREDMDAALSLIEEVFVDFPFVTHADRTNAYGALLTAVLRPCINGPVPLYVTDKPQAGVGAGLQQRVIGVIAEGREPTLKTLPAGPEMRKEILATLKSGAAIQIFDNIETKLSSPDLASVLTAAEVTGRILGQTEERTYPVTCFWMANGNNIVIGGDLARRSFKSRMDPQVAFPWQREGFRHPDLIAWARENRGRILAAIFTLARAWIQAGKPEPHRVPRVGTFEAWRDTIGGILEFAGVEEFLGNADEVYLEADADRVQWEEFLECLWEIYGCEPFQAGRVAALILSEAPGDGGLLDSLPDDLAEAVATKRKSFSRVLGRAFGKINGRHFPGGWCLKQGNLNRGIREWVIIRSVPDPLGGGVDEGVLHDLGDTATEREKADDTRSNSGRGVCGVCPPIPYAREKNTSIKNMGIKNIYVRKDPGVIHHIHHHPQKNDTLASDSDSNAKQPGEGNTPSSTPNTPLTRTCNAQGGNNQDHQATVPPAEHDPATEVKSRAPFSPDRADYVILRPPEFRQSCTRCGGRPVAVRERAAEFNRRRGTAALCAKCYAGILNDSTQAEPAGSGVEEAGP